MWPKSLKWNVDQFNYLTDQGRVLSYQLSLFGQLKSTQLTERIIYWKDFFTLVQSKFCLWNFTRKKVFNILKICIFRINQRKWYWRGRKGKFESKATFPIICGLFQQQANIWWWVRLGWELQKVTAYRSLYHSRQTQVNRMHSLKKKCPIKEKTRGVSTLYLHPYIETTISQPYCRQQTRSQSKERVQIQF